MAIDWDSRIIDAAPADVPAGSVVLYYMHTCPYCVEFASVYNALPDALAAAGVSAPIYAVDLRRHSSELAGKVRGVPMVVVKDAAGSEHIFSSKRMLAPLVDFVASALGGLAGGGKVKKASKAKAKKASPSKAKRAGSKSPKRAPSPSKGKGKGKRARLAGGDYIGDEDDDAASVASSASSSSLSSDMDLSGGAKKVAKAKKAKKSPKKASPSPSKAKAAKAKAKAKAKPKAKRARLAGGDCYIEGGEDDAASVASFSSSSSSSSLSSADLSGGAKKAKKAKKCQPGPGRPPRAKPLRAPTVQNVAVSQGYAKVKKLPEYRAFVEAEKRAGRNGFVRMGEGKLGAKLKEYVDERRAALRGLSEAELARVLAAFQRARDAKRSPARKC